MTHQPLLPLSFLFFRKQCFLLFHLSSEPLFISLLLWPLVRFGVAKVSKFFFLTSVCEKYFKLFSKPLFQSTTALLLAFRC